MIHPSYTELLEKINANGEDADTDMVLNSRYSLVLATSKRARQLIAGAKPLVKEAAGRKPLSVAIDELYDGKVKILPPKEEEEEKKEKTFLGGGDVLGVAQVSELLGGLEDDEEIELADDEEAESGDGEDIEEEDTLDLVDDDEVYEVEDDGGDEDFEVEDGEDDQ